MAHTIDQFASQCSAILKAEPGPTGRQKVCDLLKQLLMDKTFIENSVCPNNAERHLLYEDPELKFCIFVEYKSDARIGKPHDHGPSWAIYGQATGITEMTVWELLEPATADKPGKVRKKTSYTMPPGSAHVYNEGVLHSPSRTGPTRLIRFEGVNLDEFKKLRPDYEVVAGVAP